MRTTNAMLLLLGLALPAVARSHPCEAEIANLKKELESIQRAVTTIEAVPKGDTRDQMLTGAKARYDLEQRRLTEATAKCDALVAAERPGAPPAPIPAAAAAPPAPAPAPAPVPAPAPAPPPVPAPAAAPAAAAVVTVAPAVETGTPVVPPAPCLTGCGKDTDCKGDRICVKGECVDPPAKKN